MEPTQIPPDQPQSVEPVSNTVVPQVESAGQSGVSPVTPSFVPAPKGSFPWLAIMFSTLLTATILVGFYFFSQTQTLKKQLTLAPTSTPTASAIALAAEDPTEGWQTYSHKILSFKYEPTLSIKSIPVSNENPEYSFSIDKNGTQESVINIMHKNYLYKNNESLAHDLSLDEYVKWNLYENCVEKSFGELNGKLCTKNPYSENAYVFISKTEDRFVEAVSISGNPKVLEQILSTFRFTTQ